MKNEKILVGLIIVLLSGYLMAGVQKDGQEVPLQKIDSQATLGLLGTNNSLAYRVHEIEKHFHNDEDWFGKVAVPSAADASDDLTDGPLDPWQIDAGAGAGGSWGSWVQILGTGDTPNRANMVKFDMHKILIVDSETAEVDYFIQIGCDASGADALTNGNYTTIAYQTPTAKSGHGSVSFIQARVTAGTKCWARGMAIGQDTCTLDFYFGLHEYAG